MQTSAIVYKSDIKEYRVSSGAIVSSTSSTGSMRPPPPPPPPKIKMSIENKLEEPSSSIPDLEFDGTTVLCRVCGDKASGFHYGVHSCEGCKGFFRRSIQQKIQYRPCTKNQQCAILRINRNRCQYCRLKKCIGVGMSRDAVRFGRVPKREKARILAAMQQSSNSRTVERQILAELEDEQRVINTVIKSHVDSCDFTREKIESVLARARERPSFVTCDPTLACPLYPNVDNSPGQQEPQDYSTRFSNVIRGVVQFAKCIPGFTLLTQEDQVTLIRSGCFEVLFVRLACMFDAKTASICCLDGRMLRKDSIQSSSSQSSHARFLMDSMFEFADRLNCLRLTDAETALFSTVILLSPDIPGLRNADLVEKMQCKLKHALKTVLMQSRPGQPHLLEDLIQKIPDLKTLNTLHFERLNDYKMENQSQPTNPHVRISFPEEDVLRKSPLVPTWSSTDVTMDEAKSPLSSVSSTESMGCPEINNFNDYYHHSNGNSTHISQHVANAPLLAATLAGGFYPHRQRANSGSTSSGDDDYVQTSHLIHNGLTITPVTKPVQQVNPRFRKVDSPTDSGIESGPERIDKPSAPTSICSSPRSSVEDHHIVEDMPVLKRVLQAPPLYDTSSLMDEAYKPHKKFRALRNNKDSEAEPMVVMSPHQQQHSHLLAQLSAPPQSSLSSTHSTLAKTLREAPKMTVEQMKRTDLIHSYIMRSEQASPMVTASPTGCPYKAAASNMNNNNLLTTAWTTSVITTVRQPQQRPSSTSPILQHGSPMSPEYTRLFHSQSPHSTSSTSSTSSARSTCSPQSTIRRLSPIPNMLELQVNIADSQQPLNLSKKSPSPSPRPMNIIKLEVN